MSNRPVVRAPQQPPKGAQQVFKPRAAVNQFGRYFPIFYAVFGAIFVITTIAAVYFQLWLMPVFMAFPLISLVAGGVYVSRIQKTRVVIDLERLRILSGTTVKANLPWRAIARLVMKPQQQGGIVYEVWLFNRPAPITLPAGFLEDGDKLLAAISARANKPWEELPAD